MAAVPVSRNRVLARRATAHHLHAPATDGLIPLVRRLGGMHAQLGSAAEAAVWARTGGPVGPSDVRQGPGHRSDARTVTFVAPRAWVGVGWRSSATALTLAWATRSGPRPRRRTGGASGRTGL